MAKAKQNQSRNQTLYRAIKVRAYPDGKATKTIQAHFAAVAEIYNLLIKENEAQKARTGKDLNRGELSLAVGKLKGRFPTVNPQCLYLTSYHVNQGLKRVSPLNGGPGFLRKKKTDAVEASFSISCPKPDLEYLSNHKDAILTLPKVGKIRVRMHRKAPSNVVWHLVTVSRNRSGQYFVSMDYEFVKEIPLVKVKKAVGLDFSVPHLYVASDKSLVPDESKIHARQNSYQDIAKQSRKLARKKKGSKNFMKQKLRLAKAYQHMENQRMDFIQKESNVIVNDYDFVSAETLSLIDIEKQFSLYKNVSDDSWFKFTNILSYKLAERGKIFHQVNKWYPSSQTCYRCGYINRNLQLADRDYNCPKCKFHIDRDYNAAKNIRDQGLREAGFKIRYLNSNSSQTPVPTIPEQDKRS